jgi:hypothetical protein
MRRRPSASTIGSMFLHPSVHLELARQRHQDLLAAAESRRIAKAAEKHKAALGVRAGRSSERRPDESWVRNLRADSKDAVEVRHVLTAANHFGHRETADIVVDLFWSRRVGDEFRVEVEDRREHVRFVLYPLTGKAAIHAFYHPLAVARDALYDEAEAA